MEKAKRRADKRKYHYIYKTTNLINGKFYIGMHSTDDLNDGYIGSGKRLWRSIRKHGKENHKKEILEFLPDRKSLSEREKQIINEEMINDKMCMNIMIGGNGNWDHVNDRPNANHKKKEWHILGAIAANKIRRPRLEEKRKNDPDFDKQYRKNISIASTNSQIGTKYLSKNGVKKRIKKEKVNDFLNDGWKIGWNN